MTSSLTAADCSGEIGGALRHDALPRRSVEQRVAIPEFALLEVAEGLRGVGVQPHLQIVVDQAVLDVARVPQPGQVPARPVAGFAPRAGLLALRQLSDVAE